jgi:ketosteroid isomerase-like protein
VAAFHAALQAGDSTKALTLLAEDVRIIEGRLETKAAYRSGHIRGDMAFAKAVPSQRTLASVTVHGDVAWVASTSITQGDYNGRAVNTAGTELMVLSRDRDGWKIRAIQWASRERRAPGGSR